MGEVSEGKFVVTQGKFFDVIGINDDFINAMNEKYLPVKINGLDDKKGYKEVQEGISLYVKLRTGVTKYAENDRKAAIKYQRDNIAEEKRVIALAAVGEDHLRAEKKVVDDAQEAIRLENVRQEEARVQARRDRLAAISVGFNGQVWTQTIQPFGNRTLHDGLLKVMSDDQFDQEYKMFLDAAEAEKRYLEAERIAKEEETARLAEATAKQKKEEERLEALAKELAQKEIARIAAEAAEQRRKETQERLEQAEREKKVLELRAEEKRLADEKNEWEEMKAEELRKQEAAKQKAIKDEADRKQKIIDDARRAEELELWKTRQAETAKIEAEAKIKRELDEKIEKERISRIKEERRLARLPDKQKILGFCDYLDAMIAPGIKSPEAQEIMRTFEVEFVTIKTNLRNAAGEL